MGDTTEKTVAEELREAAARVREGLVPAAEAHLIPGSPIVAVCGNHVGISAICDNCAHFDARDMVLARLIVVLINAREPLASWLEEVADEAERHEAQGAGNSQDEVVHGPCLALARVLNGTRS